MAAESLGVNVYKYKYLAVIISGGLAGLGGVFLSIVANPFYLEGQTSGRGYIGLAAMIFGNWMPGGLAIGAGLFGYTDSLNLRGGSANVHALLLLGALLLVIGAIWLAVRKKYVHAVITLVVGALVFAWYAGTNEVPNQVVAATPVRRHPRRPRPVRPAAADARRRTACRTGRDRASDPVRGRAGVDWEALRAAARDAMTLRLRPLLGVRGRASRPGSTTDARSPAATSRTRRTDSACAPSAGLVSELQRTGGGRLTHFTCVDGQGRGTRPVRPLPPAAVRVRRTRTAAGDARRESCPLSEMLPQAFGPAAPHQVTPVRPLRRHPSTPGRRRAEGPRPSHPGRNAPMAMDAISVIRTKRDRGELSDEQIDWVIDAYTRGEVADEQMSALAMAILLNGMNRSEIARWTAAMIASGERMDFSSLSRPTADKHSTGGVGDKITLPLAPAGRRLRRGRPRSSPAAASATPAAPWTSWSRSPAGAPCSPTRRCCTSSTPPAR
ncbi:hypothetical protein GCM10019016_067600 [Streptomyces prasinosporus]|uniref:Glycosyl transferase family 3 N-terminal domain-containing protein n=1 Tax=Streptomyces prasinosporus TaxID=68256 RepID=A0ABP6TWC7_9ACTN